MLCVTIAPWPAAALALQEIQQNVPVDSRGATVGWLLLCRYTGMQPSGSNSTSRSSSMLPLSGGFHGFPSCSSSSYT